MVPKAEELVKQLRKRAEAYRTNQLLVLVGDDFKWSQARLYLLWPYLLWRDKICNLADVQRQQVPYY